MSTSASSATQPRRFLVAARRSRAGTLALAGLLALAAAGCAPGDSGRDASPPADAAAPTTSAQGAATSAGAPSGEVDFRAPMVELVADRLALRPGERVFAAASGLYPELPDLFADAVEARGGVWVGTLGVDGPVSGRGDPAFLTAAADADRAALTDLLRDVPVGIMLPGAGGGDPAYAAMQDLLWEGLGRHRTVHFHWGGAYGVESRADVVGAAAVAVPATGGRVDTTYASAILEVDYAAIAAAQAAFEEAARGATIRVTTPAGTDVSFRIGDRPVNRQDGDVSGERAARGRSLIDREIEFPAGAIRVAPIEESVSGRIVFPRSEWNGRTVEGLVLTLDGGIVVDASADSGLEAALAEMDENAPGGRAFREFGLGFNPRLAVPEEDPWLPNYGYGSSVVRLSLGDNSELGGAVGGGYVRWNFFLDATVTLDGEPRVEDGRPVPRRRSGRDPGSDGPAGGAASPPEGGGSPP